MKTRRRFLICALLVSIITATSAQSLPLNVAGRIDALSATQAKLAAGDYTGLDREAMIGDSLAAGLSVYFASNDVYGAWQAGALEAVAFRAPSFGALRTRLEPETVFGVPTNVHFTGVALNLDKLSTQGQARSGDADASRALHRQAAQLGAALSHSVLDSLYGGSGELSVSSLRALAAAISSGQRVYTLSGGGTSTGIALDAPLRARLDAALHAGLTTTFSALPATVGGWEGEGFASSDPDSGRGDGLAYGGKFAHDFSAGSLVGGIGPRLGWGSFMPPVETHRLAGLLGGDLARLLDAMSLLHPLAQDPYAATLSESALNFVIGSWLDQAAAGLLPPVLSAQSWSTLLSEQVRLNDLRQAPKPTVQVQASPTQVAVGEPVQLSVAVNSADPLVSVRLSVNGTAVPLDASNQASYVPASVGSYSASAYAVTSAGAVGTDSLSFSAGAEVLPLDIELYVRPRVVADGEPVEISVITSGGSGTVTRELLVDGQPLALDAAGLATLTAGGIGKHVVLAIATDSKGTVQAETLFVVKDPSDTTPPLALITSPAQDSEVTDEIPILGTASDAGLAYYELLIKPTDAPDSAWREIGRSFGAVTDGELGTLNPSTLENGYYHLALNVVDNAGNSASQVLPLEITGNLKLGQFAVTFADLNIEAAGFPIRVTRTYDTRRKHEALDFGYGWSVDYQSLRIRKNMELGLGWEVVQPPGTPTLCLRVMGKRKVAITLPDGSVERFEAYNEQDCATATLPPINVLFKPLNTSSRLEIVNVPRVEARGGQLYDLDRLETWNPTDFKLTREDGTVFYLREGVGIQRIVDRWGNTLDYTQSGVIHSDGRSIQFERDAAGRIRAITDPNGKRIVYRYNARGELIEVIDREGLKSHYRYDRDHGLIDYTDPRGIVVARMEYDEQGRLVSVTDAAGVPVEILHDTDANREVVTDRRGNATTYVYDSAGNVTQVIDPYGHTTSYTYDAHGNETSVTNAKGLTTTRSFGQSPTSGAFGKVLAETDPLNHTVSYSYEPTGEVGTVVDARNHVTRYSYFGNGSLHIEEPGRTSKVLLDAQGNPSQISIAGQTTSYSYDANGNVTERRFTRTDAGGQAVTVTLTYRYDANGKLLSETDALGNTTAYVYDGAGSLIQKTEPGNRITTYAYDVNGRLIKTSYPDGTSESIGYDPNGNEVSRTDRAGRTTRFEYDKLNRLTKTVYPDGSVEETGYDAIGQVEWTRDRNGQRTDHSYDAAGRLISVTSPSGQTVYGYDPNGNRTLIRDPDGRETRFEYDALNRLTQTTFPDGRTKSVAYREDGLKSAETDEAGNTVSYGYDALGRLTSVTLTDSTGQAVTGYGYDEAGNKTAQTDAEGRTTQWRYDSNGRPVARILPEGQTERFVYDALGNLTEHVGFDGKITRHGYDVSGQLTATTYADGAKVSYSYSPSGMVKSVTDSRGTTRYEYDLNDRLTRQTLPDGRYIAYVYDPNGNILARGTKQGVTYYLYDGDNRLKQVTDPNDQSTHYGYDGAGNLTRISYPNGVEARYGYDASGRLIQVAHWKPDTGTLITGTRYTLALDGQREKLERFDSQSGVSLSGEQLVLTNPARTFDYGYDGLKRLTSETLTDHRNGNSQSSTSYSYDKVGNRLTKTVTSGTSTQITSYSYDSNDRLLSETTGTSTTTYGWDAKGNLIRKAGDSGVILYAWSADNRLIEVKRGASDATAQVIAQYVYDADGNRVRKIEKRNGQPDRVIDYLVDSSFPYAQVLEETASDGVISEITQYVWGHQLIQLARAGQGTYYHQDGLNSATATTDAQGNLGAVLEYEAFGSRIAGSSDVEYGYTGEYFDHSIGLQYNRARWYEAVQGRFVSRDLFQGRLFVPASLHGYQYASADPANNTDPSGFETLAGQMTAVSGMARLQSVAHPVIRQALSNAGCELGMALTDAAINGIYILFDGAGNYYVGQSNEIHRRAKEHARDFSKKNMKLVAMFFVDGGKDAIRIMEQYVMDVMREMDGVTLTNQREAINMKRGRLRHQYKAFLSKVCK